MAKKETKTKAPETGEKPKKEVKQAAPAQATQVSASRNIRLHGKEFVGQVISDKASKTVTVEWERRVLLPKYERYERRYSRVYAHNEMGAAMGDTVRIKETRPLSKTKHFIVTEIVKREVAQ